LKSNLSQERTARTAAHGILEAQQNSHTALLSGIGTTLKQHESTHATLNGEIGKVDTKLGQFQEKYNNRKEEIDTKLCEQF
jgi:hypothetical protein